MASILGVETLQHTNGTTAATIDSSGNITANGYVKSEFPHFQIRSIGSGHVTGVVPFNNAAINSGNHFDTNNYYFQAPVTGLYCFMLNAFACASNGGATSGTIAIDFETSSDASSWSKVKQFYAYTNAAAYLPVHTSFITEMTANDYIRVNVTNLYLYRYASVGNEAEPHFSGYLIG